MKPIYLFFYLLLLAGTSAAQTGVSINTNGNAPHSSAMLDVQSTEKGILIPRMTTAQRTAIANVEKGLLVFDNTTSSFWFFNGKEWMELNGGNTGWQLQGNSAIDESVNFIGTTDNKPLIFKVNNQLSGTISPVSSIASWGYGALANNIDGRSNVAIGPNTLYRNTNISNLVAVGDSALYNNGVNADQSFEGIENSAVGSKALYSNSTGYRNSAVGYRALYSNISGAGNTAAGHSALYENTIGDNNTAFGRLALSNNTTGYNNSAAGHSALLSNISGVDNSAMGRSALYSNVTGSGNTANGRSAMYSNISGYSNVAIGTNALWHNTNRSNLVAIGDSALFKNGQNAMVSLHAVANTAVGSKTLFANTTGYSNTALGYNALIENISGGLNVATGYRSLYSNTTGVSNTAVGADALFVTTTGSYNTAIGSGAYASSGALSNATAVGARAEVSQSNSMCFGDPLVTKWGFGRNVTTGVLQVGDDATNGNGAYLSAAGTWVNVSDFNKKENFSKIEGIDLLKKLMELPVTRWSYKGETEVTHIGPMAQDFYRIFKVGDDDKAISSVDPSGIALRAIQQQQEIIEKLQSDVKDLREQMENLKQQVK